MLRPYKQSATAKRGIKLIFELLEAIDRSRPNDRKQLVTSIILSLPPPRISANSPWIGHNVRSFWGANSQALTTGNWSSRQINATDISAIDPLLQAVHSNDKKDSVLKIFDREWTEERAYQCCQQSTDLIGSSISPSVSLINQIRDQISVKPIRYLMTD